MKKTEEWRYAYCIQQLFQIYQSLIQTDAYLVAGIRIIFLNPLSFYNQLLAPPVL